MKPLVINRDINIDIFGRFKVNLTFPSIPHCISHTHL